MKIFLAVVILLLLIPAGAYGLFAHTTQLQQDLDDLLMQIYEETRLEDWSAASQKTERLKQKWEEAEAFWSPYVDHKEVEQMDESVARINALVKIEKKEDLLVEIGVARRLLYRIKEGESPSFGNIF